MRCLVQLLVLLYCPWRTEALSVTGKPKIAVIGGGLSGLVVGYVLQQSGRYDVELFEANEQIGGHMRQMPDPFNDADLLNIGHATHMGMFGNLRCLLQYLNVTEVPVGRGPNDEPGLFRMLSISIHDGSIVQPPIESIVDLRVWMDALGFYFWSFLDPEVPLGTFLERHSFSSKFQDILFWAMATFEFDKCIDEACEYAVGAARALLVTQIFFKYLLSDTFQGELPSKLNDGLFDDLRHRVILNTPFDERGQLLEKMDLIMKDSGLASYFTADYTAAMNKLAARIDQVHTRANVTRLSKSDDGRVDVESTMQGGPAAFDYAVLTCSASAIVKFIDNLSFPDLYSTIFGVECGSVGVKIIHEQNLPFSYPPPSCETCSFETTKPPSILGVFDISQLSTHTLGSFQDVRSVEKAGWLSIAYPVYKDESKNLSAHYLENVASAEESVYPWVRATASYPAIRRHLVKLQGHDNLHVTGHALTGVNKASELQVTSALNLCRDSFGVLPPWGNYFSIPLLPDCNDEGAFYRARTSWEAARLALKSFTGSFLLVGVVRAFGKSIFD